MAELLEERLTLEEIPVSGYEKVIHVVDKTAGLEAIIALHNMVMGPALGGTRIYPYASFDDALKDVLRLSKGMTYKSALAGSGWGGGKSVIIAHPQKQKTKKLLKAFGEAVHALKGRYICAEDVGSTTEDMDVIQSVTPYVVGLAHEKSSGNPSPFTAYGVYRGIQSVLKKIYGEESVSGRTIAIQGVGSVGTFLAERLFWDGAQLILSDINMERARELAKQYGAEVVSPQEILSVPCDVFSPCALGGVITPSAIFKMRCKAVAGAANNQLESDRDADELMRRGILYAPDFVINAGGLINVTEELDPKGYHPAVARKKIHDLYAQLMLIYDIAAQNQISTHKAAVALGDYRLKYGIGRRSKPVCFHHTGTSLHAS